MFLYGAYTKTKNKNKNKNRTKQKTKQNKTKQKQKKNKQTKQKIKNKNNPIDNMLESDSWWFFSSMCFFFFQLNCHHWIHRLSQILKLVTFVMFLFVPFVYFCRNQQACETIVVKFQKLILNQNEEQSAAKAVMENSD